MTTAVRAPDGSSLLEHLGRLEEALPSTEDVLAACLPLLQQVAEVHAKGRVAPLEGVDDLRVTSGRIWLENAKARAIRNAADLVEAATRQSHQGAIEVVAHYAAPTTTDRLRSKISASVSAGRA